MGARQNAQPASFYLDGGRSGITSTSPPVAQSKSPPLDSNPKRGHSDSPVRGPWHNEEDYDDRLGISSGGRKNRSRSPPQGTWRDGPIGPNINMSRQPQGISNRDAKTILSSEDGRRRSDSQRKSH